MKLFQLSVDDIKEELPFTSELNLVEESIEYKDEAMFSSFKLCETIKDIKPKPKKLKIKNKPFKNISFNPDEANFTIEEVEERIKTYENRLENDPEEAEKISKAILFERAKIEVLGYSLTRHTYVFNYD